MLTLFDIFTADVENNRIQKRADVFLGWVRESEYEQNAFGFIARMCSWKH